MHKASLSNSEGQAGVTHRPKGLTRTLLDIELGGAPDPDVMYRALHPGERRDDESRHQVRYD